MDGLLNKGAARSWEQNSRERKDQITLLMVFSGRNIYLLAYLLTYLLTRISRYCI